jgi:hypothetical protein
LGFCREKLPNIKLLNYYRSIFSFSYLVGPVVILHRLFLRTGKKMSVISIIWMSSDYYKSQIDDIILIILSIMPSYSYDSIDYAIMHNHRA